MSQDLWILTGDEDAIAAAAQAAPGDLIVRRTDDGVEVGELVDTQAPRVEWWGMVDEHLLPTDGEIDTAEERRGPLERIQGSSELRDAIKGVETAHRNRGG